MMQIEMIYSNFLHAFAGAQGLRPGRAGPLGRAALVTQKKNNSQTPWLCD